MKGSALSFGVIESKINKTIMHGVFNIMMKSLCLTLILLTWNIGWAPNNASKWQMEFNSAFKGLKCAVTWCGLLTWQTLCATVTGEFCEKSPLCCLDSNFLLQRVTCYWHKCWQSCVCCTCIPHNYPRYVILSASLASSRMLLLASSTLCLVSKAMTGLSVLRKTHGIFPDVFPN
jgi:hypothetical protein